MNSYFSQKEGCGTTACIAGWTTILLESDGRPRQSLLSMDDMAALRNKDPYAIKNHAAHALGFSDYDVDEDVEHLFYFSTEDKSYRDTTDAEAVTELRRLAAEAN